MYRLVEDETQRELLTAVDVDGFFVSSSADSTVITLIGTSSSPSTVPVLFEDVELQIWDVHSREIGSYYIGRVEITGINSRQTTHGQTDLEATFFGYGKSYPYARAIWAQWVQETPRETGQWKSLPAEAHRSWLHVAQQAWFRTGHKAEKQGAGSVCEIEGADLANIDSFYCALGEAVNGPGGYFGSNINALADCLINSGARKTAPFSLGWHDFEASRDRLGSQDFDEVVSVLGDFDIQISPLP